MRRQAKRLGPKFERLERALGDPNMLGELRDDPFAIVPERALVFEVASEVADFYRAVRGVPSLEFLGEDEGDAAPDEDFYVPTRNGKPKEDKRVPRRFILRFRTEGRLRNWSACGGEISAERNLAGGAMHGAKCSGISRMSVRGDRRTA